MSLQRASLPALRRDVFAATPERTLALIKAAWPGAVGPELDRRTEVVALEGGTLRVRVPDAGWRTVLHRMQRDILTRLAAVAGNLAPRRLGFVDSRLGESGPEAAQPRESTLDLTPRNASPALVSAAAVIEDVDLRACFLESAARYLARRQASE